MRVHRIVLRAGLRVLAPLAPFLAGLVLLAASAVIATGAWSTPVEAQTASEGGRGSGGEVQAAASGLERLISGRVTDEMGLSPGTDGAVFVYDSEGTLVDYAWVEDDGYYSIVVDPGVYYLQSGDYFEDGNYYVPEWYGGLPADLHDYSRSLPVDVTSADAANVDFHLTSVFIEGKVTGAGGLPLTGGYVEVLADLDLTQATLWVGPDGSYHVGVPLGSYKIRTWFSGQPDEWFDDLPVAEYDYTAAAIVELLPASPQARNVDFALGIGSATTTSSTTTSSTTTTTDGSSTTTTTTGGDSTTTTTGGDSATTTTLPSAQFTDVPAGHVYYMQITGLARAGIVGGLPDGRFQPDAWVTRQQFAKMIVKTMGFTVTGLEVCPYGDVARQMGADPLYPSKYVAVCAEKGITLGVSTGRFAPYDSITRQQLITMVTRAAALPDPPADYTPTFSAIQFYPQEHYLNARKAAYSGLLNGVEGVGPGYSFTSRARRGEVCALLYNLLDG